MKKILISRGLQSTKCGINLMLTSPAGALYIKIKIRVFNTLASARIRGFLDKKCLNACGFAREFLRSGVLYRPGKSLKRCGKSSSLQLKKIYLFGGCGFFVSDVISGGLLGHLGPLCLALGANR